MNSKVLIDILNATPSNSAKITILQSTLNLIEHLKWSDVYDIISCVSDDGNKVEAIKIIVSLNKISEQVSAFLSRIVQSISSDIYKVLAISTLIDNISIISGSEVAEILQNIKNNSHKINALKILLPYLIDFTLVGELEGLISSVNALSIIKNFSLDTNKLRVLDLLLPSLKVTTNFVVLILQNISFNNYKIDALKIIKKHFFLCENDENLLKIINTISSASNKLRATDLLKNNSTNEITDDDYFLDSLADQITDPTDYLTVANSFYLPNDLIEKYKPIA